MAPSISYHRGIGSQPHFLHPRATRPTIIAAAIALLVLTFLGTAPSPEGEEAAATTADPSEPTFAQLFEEMREPEVSAAGEGFEAVEVASASTNESNPGAGGAQGPPDVTIPVSVTPVTPALIMRGVGEGVAEVVAGVEGVAAASAATLGQLQVEVGGSTQAFEAAAVDPLAFRPLTPATTAEEPAVWERLISGDAVFTHAAGTRLVGGLGSDITVGGTAVRVGALASNGIVPVVDVMLSIERAQELGFTGEPIVYVGVQPGADLATVSTAILNATGVEPTLAEQPETLQAVLTGSDARNFFEPFNYLDHGDGLITIDPDWVARNIASQQMPIFTGTVTCHRQMLIQLYGALSDVERLGLAHIIDTSQYGGCWVARHIDWRPDRPISMHGWGLAVDFNVSTNQLGAQPTLDRRIVAVFDCWGFVWGGRWNRPDGMHFELGAVLTESLPGCIESIDLSDPAPPASPGVNEEEAQ